MNVQVVKKICISCPIGCHLVIKENDSNDLSESKYIITGNRCAKGVKYAEEEMSNPTRIVTTTIAVQDGVVKRLPVKSNAPLDKSIIFDVCIELSHIVCRAPIILGETVLSNVLNSGVDIVACRTIEHL
ncbi:DUF1667 domain-containing protein [Fusibacter bizertensis]|jgi:Uncharacterized protein with conserved CXXC pairs|uniref:DUF1667 domain-containing protein n=1 Tax=Fusibacter bizertensis TaxID=1488331 RepID=A0ABT6NHC8_9FIRM|nr:DUF1667 domain-containing protein [Fusibacter bizertensis]MDH8679837.1 DUF1667 domain-containing protein [Fusibacter bizertensis]